MKKPMAKINRGEIWNKYDKHCGYCGKDIIAIKDMQIDHIKPQWQFINGYIDGDMNHINNLMPTCRTCNHYKRGHDLEGYRRLMTTLHERVCSHYIGQVALKYGIVQIKPFDGIFYFETYGKQP